MTTYNLYLDFESREYQIEANSPEEAEKILADRIEKEIKEGTFEPQSNCWIGDYWEAKNDND